QRPRPIGKPCVVAEVDEVLVRHRHEALVQNGEPAHPRVEDAYGSPVHRGDSRTPAHWATLLGPCSGACSSSAVHFSSVWPARAGSPAASSTWTGRRRWATSARCSTGSPRGPGSTRSGSERAVSPTEAARC